MSTAGAPASGVTVSASSKALLHPRTTITGARGTYWIGSLPPGEYDITFARAGLTTLTRRAVVELARVSRADAALEASEDEESVTSTAKTISVADTTEITTHFSDAMLDRLPTRRDPRSAAAIGPAFLGLPDAASIDDVPFARTELLGEEAIEQVTVLRAGLPAESDDDRGTVLAAVTRSGGDAFSLTARDTITSFQWNGDGPFGRPPRGILHLFESAAGGRIVPDRLWFFAAGWSGDSADRPALDLRGFATKLTAQLADAHQAVAEMLDGDSSSGFGESLLALRYTATPAERATFDALLARSNTAKIASARATVRIGEHLLSAGGTERNDDQSLTTRDSDALYLSDRWSAPQWTLKAGLRYERDDDGSDALPRVAATFDPIGDGRRAIEVTYGEYARTHEPAIRMATIGYAAAIGSSGSARIDVLRREESTVTVNELQLDARYRLFDRFEAGANYGAIAFVGRDVVDHIAAGWISAELPVGRHELGATLLQRWSDTTAPVVGRRSVWPTDLGLRYSIPFSRIGLTVAADGMNVFATSRALRVRVRARM